MSEIIRNFFPKKHKSEDESKEMGFLDHLEELRWHVIRAGIAVIVIAIIALVFQNEVFEYIIYAPKKTVLYHLQSFLCYI